MGCNASAWREDLRCNQRLADEEYGYGLAKIAISASGSQTMVAGRGWLKFSLIMLHLKHPIKVDEEQLRRNRQRLKSAKSTRRTWSDLGIDTVSRPHITDENDGHLASRRLVEPVESVIRACTCLPTGRKTLSLAVSWICTSIKRRIPAAPTLRRYNPHDRTLPVICLPASAKALTPSASRQAILSCDHFRGKPGMPC